MIADKRRQKTKIVATFLASYAIILIIPVIVGIIVYSKTVTIVKEEVTSNNVTLLEQSKSILDRRLAELDAIMQQIAASPKVSAFQGVTNPFIGANTYKVRETANELYNYGTSNNFMLGYYILYKNSGLVLSPNNAYKYSEFADQIYRENGMESEDWRSVMLGHFYQNEYIPAKEAVFKGRPTAVVHYVRSLGYPGYVNGVVLVLIDNNEIQKLLRGFDLQGGGWAYITDEKGRIISSVSNEGGRISEFEQQLGAQGVIEASDATNGMMITYTTLDTKGWKFVVAQSPNIVLQKANYIRDITAALFFILLFGIIAICAIAYRRSKPIRNLVLQIVERSDGAKYRFGSEYKLIETNFSLLESNNHQLQAKLQEQLPFVRAVFYGRLLKGDFTSEAELRTVMEHTGIRFEGNRYAVVLLRLQSYEGELSPDILKELEIKRIMVKELLSRQPYGHCICHDVEQDKIAIIAALGVTKTQQCQAQLESLLEQMKISLQEHHQMTPLMAVGGMYGKLAEISRSYEEARQAMNERQWEICSDTIWFHQLSSERTSYYYPPDVELRLMNLIKAGEQDEAEELLNDIFQHNRNMHLSLYIVRLLIFNMWGTAMKLTEQTALDDEGLSGTIQAAISDMHAHENLSLSFQRLKQVFGQISATIGLRRKSQNTDLIDRIIEYIDCNYTRSDLCLTEVAEKFNMSETYLSQFFKDRKGINFIEYVEEIRMGNAKQLLAQTELPIHAISSRIGYSSSSTFCRAFKRINGISATVYRQMAT